MAEYSMTSFQSILSRPDQIRFSNISIGITDSVYNTISTSISKTKPTSPLALDVMAGVRSALILLIFCYILKILWIIYNDESGDPRSKLPLPPGQYGLPLLGESLSFFLNPTTFYKKRFHQYGRVFKTHLFGKPTIRLIGPEMIEPVLQHEKQLVGMSWPQSVHHLLGDEAMSNQADMREHLRMRKIIAKAFTPEALQSYLPRVSTVVSHYLQNWCNKKDVLVYTECKQVASALSANLILGLELKDDEEFHDWYSSQICVTSNLFSLPLLFPWGITGLSKGMQARSHIINIIKEARSHYKQKGGIDSVLSRVEKEGGLSKSQLQDCLIELCIAGLEPLSSAFYSIVKELGQRPEIIRSLLKEFGEFGLLEEQKALSISTINQMKYTNNVIKEVLRLSPPIGGAFRKVNETFEINGYQIPRGWSLIYSIRDTQDTSPHSDSNFLPERWDTINESRLRLNYMPFGSGTFACPGKKLALLFMTVWLIELVRGTQFELTGETVPPRESYLPTPKPLDGLPARFSSKE